jgi:hypothetical protein
MITHLTGEIVKHSNDSDVPEEKWAFRRQLELEIATTFVYLPISLNLSNFTHLMV